MALTGTYKRYTHIQILIPWMSAVFLVLIIVFSPLHLQGLVQFVREETILEAYKILYIRELRETTTRELLVWNQTGQNTGNPWHLPIKGFDL